MEVFLDNVHFYKSGHSDNNHLRDMVVQNRKYQVTLMNEVLRNWHYPHLTYMCIWDQEVRLKVTKVQPWLIFLATLTIRR